MNTYIKQLIEQIEVAIKKAPVKYNANDDELEFDTHFATEFLQGKPEMISQIVGIDKFNFPNTDKLNEKQLEDILDALEELLKAYNWEFMFPESVTNKVKYQFIIDNWDSKHVQCQQGVVQIETCKFDEDDCPFPGHCNVCHSFKNDNDTSHHLCKGKVDFESLVPGFSNEEDENLRADVDKLKELIKQPKCDSYITGIHNYCDGRCKKCQFTEQCSSFALNKELDSLKESDEQQNGNQLKVIFKATSELIEEELNKKGLDITDAMAELEGSEDCERKKHNLEKQAESYAEKVTRWLESNQMELESRMVASPELGIGNHFETITWFQLFIPAKINRAINGFNNDKSSECDLFDARGSSKIALIAIDESIKGWENILHIIPQKEDGILNILRHLSKLRKELEEYSPNARDFVRPGFDE